MPHMLARLRGVELEAIRDVLRRDAPDHAREGLHLEHLWRNADDHDEVLFLFRVEDVDHVRRFIERVHGEARAADPNANLPVMTYLEE